MKYSIAEKIGGLLAEELRRDPRFYFFSPDETTSNKFSEVFKVSGRAWNSLIKEWDLPESSRGRIVELLSENTLFATMVGHLANGERAVMGSYESFFMVIASQILQQIKFFKQMDEVSWRKKWPAVNLLSTSVCWRQDHNGFTHQSPALISTLLDVPSNKVNCYFPVDDISGEAIFREMVGSENVVNLTTFDKNLGERWCNDYGSAQTQLENKGVGVFEVGADGMTGLERDELDKREPEIVFTAAGDIVSREVVRAVELLRKDGVEVRMRFINLLALSYRAIGTVENKLSSEEFLRYFGEKSLIIANFHGYPETLKGILGNYTDSRRVFAHGFVENGSTTTPFSMLMLNRASRYDLAISAAKVLGRGDLAAKYAREIEENLEYARAFGVDKVDL